jgi:hypothetical protein
MPSQKLQLRCRAGPIGNILASKNKPKPVLMGGGEALPKTPPFPFPFPIPAGVSTRAVRRLLQSSVSRQPPPRRWRRSRALGAVRRTRTRCGCGVWPVAVNGPGHDARWGCYGPGAPAPNANARRREQSGNWMGLPWGPHWYSPASCQVFTRGPTRQRPASPSRIEDLPAKPPSQPPLSPLMPLRESTSRWFMCSSMPEGRLAPEHQTNLVAN